MREIEESAAEAYATRFGERPQVVASAPGRINLIGEHTDYNDGFVLPMAIDLRLAAAVGPGDGTLYSLDFDETGMLSEAKSESWIDYPGAGCAGPSRDPSARAGRALSTR